MAKAFDPYHRWLGIRPEERPISHYRLLGLVAGEDDPDVIEGAADSRMAHVRTYQSGPQSSESQRILNELSNAKICLLDPVKKAAYDATLNAPPPLAPLPTAVPVAPAVPLAPVAARVADEFGVIPRSQASPRTSSFDPLADEGTAWGQIERAPSSPGRPSNPPWLWIAAGGGIGSLVVIALFVVFSGSGGVGSDPAKSDPAKSGPVSVASNGAGPPAVAPVVSAVVVPVQPPVTPVQPPGPPAPAPTGRKVVPAAGYEALLAKPPGLLFEWKHPLPIGDVAISPDSGRLATLCQDGRVRVFNLLDGSSVTSQDTHHTMSLSIAWHPDSSQVVSSGCDNTVRVWDPRTGAQLHKMRHEEGRWAPVSVSQSGLAVVGADGEVRCWNAKTGQAEFTFAAGCRTLATAISPDDRYALVGGTGGKLYVRNLESRKLDHEPQAHQTTIVDISSASAVHRMATTSSNGQVVLWNEHFEMTHVFHLDSTNLKAASLSGDGKRLAAGGTDGKLHVIDLETMHTVITIPTREFGVGSASLSHDGRIVAASGMDLTARAWRLPDPGATPAGEKIPFTTPRKAPVAKVVAPPAVTQPVVTQPVVTQPVVTQPVVTQPVVTPPVVVVHTPPQVAPLVSSKPPGPPGQIIPPPFPGGLRVPEGEPVVLRKADVVFERVGQNTITYYALGTRGRMLTARHKEGPTTWDVAAGRALPGQPFLGTSPACSPDGRRLAMNEDNNSVVFWDFDGSTIERKAPFPKNWGPGWVIMSFSADAQWVSLSSGGKYVGLVHISGNDSRKIEPLGDFCSQAEFSLDGRQLLAVTPSRIERFSLPDGQPLAPLEVKIERYTFYPIDAHRAVGVSAVDKRKMLLVNIHDGKEVGEVTLPAEIGSLRITPDRRGALLATRDGWLRVWHFDANREAARIANAGAFYMVATPDGYVVAGNSGLSAWRLPDSVWDRAAGYKWVGDGKPAP